MLSMDELFRGIRRCRKCERCSSRKLAVPGEGRVGAELFLIGEAPGKQEDMTGRPFVGRAGRYLDEVLAAHGVSRNRVFVTSILKCYHPGPPNRRQVEICKAWTIHQVEAVKPKRILVMGLTAARGLLGVKRLGARASTTKLCGIPCVVTCHPASAVRFPQQNKQFRRGFDRLMGEGPRL